MKPTLRNLSLTLICVSFFPSLAIADGFTGWRKVDFVYQRQCTPNRGFEIRLMPAHDNPDSCENKNVVEVPCGIPPYEAAVDMALTTLAIGGELRAFVVGCDAGGQAIVRAIMARPPQQPVSAE